MNHYHQWSSVVVVDDDDDYEEDDPTDSVTVLSLMRSVLFCFFLPSLSDLTTLAINHYSNNNEEINIYIYIYSVSIYIQSKLQVQGVTRIWERCCPTYSIYFVGNIYNGPNENVIDEKMSDVSKTENRYDYL